MGIVARRSLDGFSQSAFHNIVVCQCAHGIGDHERTGCTKCECKHNPYKVIETAIEQDRAWRSLLYRSDMRAYLNDRYPHLRGGQPLRRSP